MSFDLGFWREETPPSSAQARRTYNALVEQTDGAPAPNCRIAEFLADLHRRYPDLTEETADTSPWSVPVWSTPGAVIVSLSWSRVADVADDVVALAGSHGLTTFDPQDGAVVPAAGQS